MLFKDFDFPKLSSNEPNYNMHDAVQITSHNKVLLICELGHEWASQIRYKVNGQASCPFCKNKILLFGFNDLATTFPLIAEEFHPNKNGVLLPHQIIAATNQKVWWLGSKCGHEWLASVRNRTSCNSGCPYCANKKVLKGFNDFPTTHPHIAKEWHPTKNGSLKPEDYTFGSSTTMAWWRDSHGHEWQATISSRCSNKRGCPYCANKKILKGFNDFETTHPCYLAEWDYDKNTILPDSIMSSFSEKVWWIGKDCLHSWQSSPLNRIFGKRNCPYCSNNQLLTGFNDFKTLYPLLMKEWHPTKNQHINPSKINLSYKEQKVWWICEEGHEWQAYVYQRTRKHKRTNCPVCVTSYAQKEIVSWLKEQGIQDIQENTRTILSRRKELDIYLPAHKLAIEYNGIYWHAEDRVKGGQHVHYDKWKECQQLGIELVQIWEDDWISRQKAIKRILTDKLSSQPSDLCNNLYIKEVGMSDALDFVETYSATTINLENFSDTIKIGSYKADVLSSVLVVKKAITNKAVSFEIVEYICIVDKINSFDLILKHLQFMYPTIKEISIFSDNSISEEELYISNGFTYYEDVLPDYMYVIRNQRLSKRTAVFSKLPKLIWDAGTTKWTKYFN